MLRCGGVGSSTIRPISASSLIGNRASVCVVGAVVGAAVLCIILTPIRAENDSAVSMFDNNANSKRAQLNHNQIQRLHPFTTHNSQLQVEKRPSLHWSVSSSSLSSTPSFHSPSSSSSSSSSSSFSSSSLSSPSFYAPSASASNSFSQSLLRSPKIGFHAREFVVSESGERVDGISADDAFYHPQHEFSENFSVKSTMTPALGFGDFRPPHPSDSEYDEDDDYSTSTDQTRIDLNESRTVPNPESEEEDFSDADSEHPSEKFQEEYEEEVFSEKHSHRKLIVGDAQRMPPFVSSFGFPTQQAHIDGEMVEGCYCDHYVRTPKLNTIFSDSSTPVTTYSTLSEYSAPSISSEMIPAEGDNATNVHPSSTLLTSTRVLNSSSSQHHRSPDLLERVDCYCEGRSICSVPTNFSRNAHKIVFRHCGLEKLTVTDLQLYQNVTEILLTRMPFLHTIEPNTFSLLPNLMSIYIKLCPRLTHFPSIVLADMPSLMYLKIIHSGLEEIPIIEHGNSSRILSMIDFDNNKIRNITTRSINVKTESLNIEYNQIEFVSNYAFYGSQIAKLSLKGNRNLIFLENLAFAGITFLRELDLSLTSITKLPVLGLSDTLRILRVIDTTSLMEIPFLFHLNRLEEAHLTYPHHCCAFHNPEKHNPTEYERLKKLFSTDSYCRDAERKQQRPKRMPTTVSSNPGKLFPKLFEFLGLSSSTSSSPLLMGSIERNQRNVREMTIDLPAESFEPETDPESLHNTSDDDFRTNTVIEFELSGKFGNPTNTFQPRQDFCGDIVSEKRTVICTPMPDAFNPCEDVMGNWFLRVMIWCVLVCSLSGNFVVFSVLSSSKYAFNSQRFLMINLAVGDFSMGVYLLMIAIVDVNTRGQYFNYAIKWQYGLACRVAGFVTVFASCLSIFTLTIITLERWFAITYAIQLNRRLKLSLTIKIMIGGWIYSVIMALLPLAGINSYSKTSICLPMEHRNGFDIAYLFALLCINALAFVLITACYLKMYISIISQKTRTTVNDVTIAKRMALLVFTDFACWAPISFFGATALLGYPLINVPQSKFLLVIFYPLNSCANPFLYAIFTKQYRRDFFILASRYGLCVNQAMQYRSGPRLNHHFAARYEACRHQLHHHRQANSMPMQAASYDALASAQSVSQKVIANNWSLPICPEAHSLTLPRSVSRCELGSGRDIAGSHSSVYSHSSCEGVILYRYNCRTNRHHYFSTFNRRPTFASTNHRIKELTLDPSHRSHQSCSEFHTSSFVDFDCQQQHPHSHSHSCHGPQSQRTLSKSFDEYELDRRHRKHKRCHHGSHRYTPTSLSSNNNNNRFREMNCVSDSGGGVQHSVEESGQLPTTNGGKQRNKQNATAMVVLDNGTGGVSQVLAIGSNSCRKNNNHISQNGASFTMNGDTHDDGRHCSDHSPAHSNTENGRSVAADFDSHNSRPVVTTAKRSSVILSSLIEKLNFFSRTKHHNNNHHNNNNNNNNNNHNNNDEHSAVMRQNNHNNSSAVNGQADEDDEAECLSGCSSTSSDHYFERHRYQKNSRSHEPSTRKCNRSKLSSKCAMVNSTGTIKKRRSPKRNHSESDSQIQMKDQREMLRIALQETTTVEEAIAVVEELSTATTSSKGKSKHSKDSYDS